MDASSIERDERRNRAMTLLKTMTMQNVAWPTATVNAEKPMAAVLIVALRAIPVTMPGRAIGSTNRKEMDSRPKNENRWIARAAREPSRIATIVAPNPTWTDRTSASIRSPLARATPNQSVVKRSIGQAWARSALKAYSAIVPIGTYRKATTATLARRSAIRLTSLSQSVEGS